MKILNLGDSGGGKTGALATLINTGLYEFFIIDFDNGLDILLEYVKPEFLDKVHFVTCTDPLTPGTQGPKSKGVPKGFSTAMRMLDKWQEEGGKPLGGVLSWGPDVVVVIDSLTMLGESAMRYTLSLNGRAGEHPWQSDWGEAMERQQRVLEMLYSTSVKCHVIVNAHILKSTKMAVITKPDGKEIQVEVETDKGFPSALGKKLPPKIGRYFNTMVRTFRRGQRCYIKTVSDPDIDLKTPFPETLDRELEVKGGDPETGLGRFFSVCLGRAKEQSEAVKG